MNELNPAKILNGWKFITAEMKDISHLMRNDVVELRCGVNCKGGGKSIFHAARSDADGWYTNIPAALQIFRLITF